MTPDLPVTIVDAFTRQPGAGNRAGVMLDAGDLSADEMTAIARAVAASETAFLWPASAGTPLRLRYFTPSAEVGFCGHATVATFHLLAEIGRLPCPGRASFECPAGTIEVELEPAGDSARVWIATPRAPWEPSPIPRERLASLLGAPSAALVTDLPAERSGAKLFVPVAGRVQLHALTPRWDELRSAGTAVGLHGFYAFALDAEEPGHLSQGRFFAPAVGVSEDPVTGSASGPFAEYLVRHGALAPPAQGGPARARIEQGQAMGKPGLVDLEVQVRARAVERVRIGGVAVTVLQGALRPAAEPRAAVPART